MRLADEFSFLSESFDGLSPLRNVTTYVLATAGGKEREARGEQGGA
jgi:hypothetical protein